MQRLLQGEVGSGKTLVALRAMLAVVDAGGQAALLAPTEVLAAQHRQTITRLLGDLAEPGTLGAAEHATGVALLTGSLPAARRREALARRAASGEAGLVVGTHALLSEDVAFADLGLVVVDEQHRFGVEQRAALGAKADRPPARAGDDGDADPALGGDDRLRRPGDLDAARAARGPGRREHGGGRRTAPAGLGRPGLAAGPRGGRRRPAGVRRLRPDLVGRPRPAAGEDLRARTEDAPPAAAAEDLLRRAVRRPARRPRVEMLHGQLPTEEKDAVMARFAAGETDVLVATTVIEVGVDVPNASVMVICDADRFGISQLHQLRGRIGRGAHPGVCLLLTGAARGHPWPGTGWPPWPRPATASPWPRSTSSSAARATCWAPASPAAGPACGCCGCSTTPT